MLYTYSYAHVLVCATPDAFVVNNGIPLWPLWEQYFSKCEAGSYTIVIHQQHQGKLDEHGDKAQHEQSQRIRKQIRKVGGRFVCSRFRVHWEFLPQNVLFV